MVVRLHFLRRKKNCSTRSAEEPRLSAVHHPDSRVPRATPTQYRGQETISKRTNSTNCSNLRTIIMFCPVLTIVSQFISSSMCSPAEPSRRPTQPSWSTLNRARPEPVSVDLRGHTSPCASGQTDASGARGDDISRINQTLRGNAGEASGTRSPQRPSARAQSYPISR